MKRMTSIVRLLMFFPIILCAQLNPGVTSGDLDRIAVAVDNVYGKGKYEVNDVINVDSTAGKKWVTDFAIENPYGTLNHCYVFTVSGKYQDGDLHARGFIGVFKENQIIWHSDTLINNGDLANAGFLGISDINRDGKVELLTFWSDGTRGDVTYIWIVSWDGNAGQLVNSYDSEGRSRIVLSTDSIELIDVQGNGVKQIQGKWYQNEESEDQVAVAYCWNGAFYDKCEISQPQAPRPKYRLLVSLGAKVRRISNQYQFLYLLGNSPTSLQKIQDFAITKMTSAISGVAGRNGWEFILSQKRPLLLWEDMLGEHPISQSEADSSFSFSTSALPSPQSFFVQGNNGELSTSDILSNAARGMTLGPSDPPNPFVPLDFLDTLIVYTTRSRSLGWIQDQTTANKYQGYCSSAKASLVQNNIASARVTLQQVLHDVDVDSSATLTSEAYALLRFNTEYVLSQLPVASAPGLNVKLINSTGTSLTGGSLQYYEGSWKDATNNNDGTFSITTALKTLSLRMTYEYGSQTKSNVTVGPDVVVFQTVSAQVQLQNSQGALLDTGSVQYYAGAWRTFGTTTSGVASKELLPGNYSFRMTYAGGSNDKQQDIGSNPVVVFQTVNASVQLKNTQGTPIDQGTVQYYAGAWRNFGTTTNGVVNKELLPNNYSFRMTYAYGSKDLQQNIGSNPVVVFQTANATVQLKNSQGALVDQGTVQYYAGAWRTFGTTSGGTVSKELLPISYSFRITNEGVSNDKTQDISANSTVSFSTILCTVSVKNSQAQPVNNATISYYAGVWRQIGQTVNGQITKELLPANLTFRMTLGTASQDKAQNIATSSLVEFVTQ